MNKKRRIIFLTLMLFLFNISFVKANANIVEVTDISIKDKSGTITVEDPVLSLNEISSNISFNQQNDYVTFELVLKNISEDKYKISSVTDNLSNDNLLIEYSYDDNYASKDESLKLNIKMTYKNKLLNSESLSLNDLTININLLKYDGTTSTAVLGERDNNPNTRDTILYYLIFLILTLAILISIVLLRKNRKFKNGFLVLLVAIVLSFSTKTLAEEVSVISIKFNNITIKGEIAKHKVVIDDGNGPVEVEVTHGENVELPEPPEREGYTFAGWYTNPDCTEGNEFDASNTDVENDINVYAKWNTIVITFETNGGTLATYTKNVAPGSTVGELPVPQKDGETFFAWYQDSSFNTMVTSETIPEEDTTYYAKYANGLNITYNANGGKYNNNATTQNISYVTNALTIYSHTPNVNDNGNTISSYEYSGETLTEGKYPNNYEYNDIITIPGAPNLNIEVWYSTESTSYDWLAIYPGGVTPTYDNYDLATISDGKLGDGQHSHRSTSEHKSFVVNGDTAQLYFRSDVSANYFGYYAIITGDSYVGNAEVKTPTRDGYVFSGWYTDAECTDGNEFNLASISNGDIVYAKWEPIFVVTYNANGGTYGDTNIHETSYYHGTNVINYSKTSNNNTSGESNGNYYDTITEVKRIENAAKLDIDIWYSTNSNKWVAIYPGEVEADNNNYLDAAISHGKLLNNGNYSKDNAGHSTFSTYNDTATFYINDYGYYYGYYAVITANTYKASDYIEPTKEGFRFAGWCEDPECTIEFDVNNAHGGEVAYAKWESFKITLDTNGGILENNIVNIKPGSAVGELPMPEKENASFVGWFVDEELIHQVTSDMIIEGDVTYYAKYAENINLIFNANGGQYSDTTSAKTIPYFSNEIIKFSHTPNIDDNGVANGRYSNYLSIVDTVTIPEADSLKIKIWYAAGDDWVAIYPANVTPSSYNYSQATISNGKLSGSYSYTKEDATFKEYTVNDDTVKFFFYSNYSSNYYGYYAIISYNQNKTNADIEIPTRDGYEFVGWYTDPDCTHGNEFDPKNGIEEGMQVYARWSQIVDIAFDANGGTYEDNTSIQEVPYYIGKVTRYAHSSNVNDDGTAKGVYPRDARELSPIKINGSPYLDIDIWYSISDYVSNGRNYVAIYPEGLNPDGEHFGYDNASTYATISNGPLNGGNGTTKNESTHKSFSYDGDTALFYFFSYYTPSGQYGYGYYATIKGETYITNSEIVEPTWDRHTFKGWYTDAECTNGNEWDGNVTPGMTIYAKWISDYVVTLDANGGTYDNNVTSIDLDFNYGETTKYSYTPNIDANGEMLSDYNKRTSLKDVVTIPGADSIDIELNYSTYYNDFILVLNKDVNIFNSNNSISGKLSGSNSISHYTRNYTLNDDTVQFYFKSGDYGSSDYGYYATITGIGYHSNDTYVEPTKEGYLFDGWCTNPECTGDIIDDINSVAFGEDTTLYAKWNKASYTITYNANGGTYDNQSTTLNNVYNYGVITKYSHTPNIDDNGDRIDGSDYISSYSEFTDVVNFGNSRKMNINLIIYTNSSYYDVLAIYPKGIIPTQNNYDLATISGGNIATYDSSAGYTGSNNSKYNYLNNIYDVNDNEVTFYYKVGNSSVYYGYYAKITGYGYQTTDTVQVPTRDGYSFEGWYTDAECTNKFVESEYTSTDNIEVYAKWLENYNVTFNANGGLFSNHTNTNVNEYGYKYITRKSHTSNINDEGDNPSYHVYTGFLDINETLKIAGATNLSIDAWYGTYANNGADYFAIYDADVKPNGQNYDQSISGKLYCESYCNYSDKKGSARKVHYDVDGDAVNVFFYSAGMSGNYGYYIEVSGYGYDNLDTYEEPTRDGYSFGGWYLNPECTGEKVDINDITSAVTLYAKWNSTYTITYDANDGIFEDENTFKNIEFYIGNQEQIIHSSNINDSGYMNSSYTNETKTSTYIGADKVNVRLWYALNDDDDYLAVYSGGVDPSISDASNSISGKLTGGKNTSRQNTLYKTFDVPGDTVQFYLSADDINNNYYGYYAILSGDGFVPSDDYEEPTREGYTFAGWYTNPECTDGNEIDPSTIDTTMTIYAKWISYVVTFNPTEGELDNNIKHISIGSFIGDMPTPTRDGYSFEGWYTDTNYTERVYSITVPDGDITIYAKWKKDISIIYDANGGLFSNNANSKDLSYKWTETVLIKHSSNFDDNGTYMESIYNAEDDYIVEIPGADNLYVEIWHSTGSWSYGSINIYPDNNRLSKAVAIGGPYPDYPTLSYATSLLDAKKDVIEFNTNKIGVRFYASSSMFGYYAKIHGASYQTDGDYEDPTRNGYVFAGWCLDAECTEDANINELDNNVTLYAKWKKETINVTYNANGGTYQNSSDNQNVSYTYGEFVKYSHTPNVDDNGTANGQYSNSYTNNDIVVMGDARKIEIELWYSIQYSGSDYLAIYPGGVEPTTSNYSLATISNGRLYGSEKTTKEEATYKWGIVNGNTAQFYFRTNNDDKNYYGYYAIIKAVEYHTNDEVEEPTLSGKTFAGWYTNPECTDGNEFDTYKTLDDIVVYAKWQ